MNRFSIKIAGPAGFGIKVTGQILAKYFLRSNFCVFCYTEYPSLIRGGHNNYQIDVADEPIHSSAEKCDILIGFTKEAVEKEVSENKVMTGSVIICDKEIETKKQNINKINKIEYLQVPLIEISKKIGSDLMKNTVALGVLLSILDLPLDKLNEILKQEFGDKEEVVEENLTAAKAGYKWVKKLRNKDIKIQRYKEDIFSIFKFTNFSKGNADEILITGNQVCALGCIASNCQVYVAYPMTPATEILHYLEAKQRETGMIVHQPEDEIAGIHVALGASFAGARAATGTSGGGFALMNEGLSLAGMLELPIVIFEVQRPAPATGNPTWTEQGDLLYAINSGHGEFSRVVLAPGDPTQCFQLTQQAFNLADKFQIPVIILSDKYLGESAHTMEKSVFDKTEPIDRGKITKSLKHNMSKIFARYKIENDGVSWRTIPDVKGGEHIANSDEHNEFSYSDESSEVRKAMVDKRMKKLEEIKKEIPLPRVYGPKDADATLVCWGSQLGHCIDALEHWSTESTRSTSSGQAKTQKAQKYGVNKVNVIHFSYLWPLPFGLDKFLAKFKKLILVENNKTAQLGKLIRQETGIEIKDKILKYDSRPFWKEEIIDKIHG